MGTAVAELRGHAFYTAADIARLLQVHIRTVKRWMEPGENGEPAALKSRKIGGIRRVAPEDFEAFADGEEDTP